MASATSASVTATMPLRVLLLIGQVSSPGIGVSRASQIERAAGSIVSRFPEEDRQAMVGDDGLIRVDCEFCGSHFSFEPEPA